MAVTSGLERSYPDAKHLRIASGFRKKHPERSRTEHLGSHAVATQHMVETASCGAGRPGLESLPGLLLALGWFRLLGCLGFFACKMAMFVTITPVP